MHHDPDIRVGLVGYGWGGRYFHAPVIEAAVGAVLAGVVSTSETRGVELGVDFPEVPLHDSLESLVATGVDALVLSVPVPARKSVVKAAMELCPIVILDKPFATDAAAARELIAEAHAAGCRLGVYQNRRWDTNITTLRSVLAEDRLGTIRGFESVFAQDEPRSVESRTSGGALLDLGSHLVDQALWLFGGAARVSATMIWTDTSWGINDSALTLRIDHSNGVTSWLSADKLAPQANRMIRTRGDAGTLMLAGRDIQAEALLKGQRPAENPAAWGIDPADGFLVANGHMGKVASRQGSYHRFYELLADAVRHEKPLPVCACRAVATMQVLDAARLSAAQDGLEISGFEADSGSCRWC